MKNMHKRFAARSIPIIIASLFILWNRQLLWLFLVLGIMGFVMVIVERQYYSIFSHSSTEIQDLIKASNLARTSNVLFLLTLLLCIISIVASLVIKQV